MLVTAIKAIAEIACLVGSEVIVNGIVKTTLSPNGNKVLRACSQVATVCVAGVLGAAAGKYADESIDDIADTVKKLSSGNKEGAADGAT